jgi:hypothetical protein
MIAAWGVFVLCGIAVTFGYHVVIGWRTRVVRLPLSLLAIEEFDRDQNPEYFWGVMVLDIVGIIASSAITIYIALSVVNISTEPISRLQRLNACYEGQGLPDFMRPPHHWSLRITDGVIIDRDGNTISKINLGARTGDMTAVTFLPGILISGKPVTVLLGDTVSGKAYLKYGRATLVLSDDWGNVMQQTSCD